MREYVPLRLLHRTCAHGSESTAREDKHVTTAKKFEFAIRESHSGATCESCSKGKRKKVASFVSQKVICTIRAMQRRSKPRKQVDKKSSKQAHPHQGRVRHTVPYSYKKPPMPEREDLQKRPPGTPQELREKKPVQ